MLYTFILSVHIHIQIQIFPQEEAIDISVQAQSHGEKISGVLRDGKLCSIVTGASDPNSLDTAH